MALKVQVLGCGKLTAPAPPAVLTVTDARLYSTPNQASPTVEKKAAIVTSMRFVNPNAAGTAPVTFNIYFFRAGFDPSGPAANGICVLPFNLSLAGGQVLVETLELAMEPGDALAGVASAANTIDYWISGIERDVL
jgi:hypothetical protein